MSRALWILQVLLALMFLFAGGFKLAAPGDVLTSIYSPPPNDIMRFIGTTEFLCAVGLVLSSLLRIAPWLTPLAAVGLAVEMAGAAALTPTLFAQDVTLSVIPMVLGVLVALVAYGRMRLSPIQPRPRRHLTQA